MAPASQSTSNIWTAASDGDADRVKHLIENEGLSPNVKDSNGYTAIHAAVSWNHPSLLRYLLSKGADINITDNDGDTPLFVVEDMDMVKLVLELGGDPHLHNEQGQTAAMALAEDQPDISAFLCTLTGESLPESSSAAMSDRNSSNTRNPEEELASLDPVSRQAAMETNQRAGALLERVQAILMDADARGEDPEERIRAVVDEAVRGTMEAGRRMAEMEVDSTQVDTASAAAPLNGESGKRPRQNDEPSR